MRELETNMYFGAKPDLVELAKSLRNAMTYHESLLWEKLKANRSVEFALEDSTLFISKLLIFIVMKQC